MKSAEPMNGAGFKLGLVVKTAGVEAQLEQEEILSALARHQDGDWGLCDERESFSNDVALTHGLRLLSIYRDSFGVQFYIITEADRSKTTILLPDEY